MLIKGESELTVVRGSVDVFGADVNEGEGFYLPVGRQIPIIGLEDALIRIRFSGELLVKNIDFDPIPDEWNKVLDEAEKGSKVMIIGDVDVGKSGLALYLANKLLKKGFKVGIVDSDIGQSDIGPPTTIGLAILRKPSPTYWDLPLKNAYFVGDKTPTGHLLPMVVGVRKLIDEALKCGVDKVILNTTGYIYGGAAHALKRYKIEIVNPDLLVFIQKANELSYLVNEVKGLYKTVVIPVPKSIAVKTREDRVEFRSLSLSKYFKNAKTIRLQLNDVRLRNVAIYKYSDLVKEFIKSTLNIEAEAAFCDEKSAIVLLKDYVTDVQFSNLIKALKAKFEEVKVDVIKRYVGLVLGLFDDGGVFRGLGRLRSIDFKSGTIEVDTNVDEKAVKEIHFGYIVLDERFNEVSSIKPGTGLI